MRELKVFLATILVGLTIQTGYRHYFQPKPVAKNETSTQTKRNVQEVPTTDELLLLVNAERAKVGVAPLTIDNRLNESAQRKADDMTKYKYFEHISPNDGKHGYEYINDTGLHCIVRSENLNLNSPAYNTSKDVVKGWVSSPEHYTAMIDPGFSITGFGVSGNYAVEHFCKI